jgi:hypothetical protein
MGTDNLIDDIVYEPMPINFDGRGSQRGWVFSLVMRGGMVCMYRKDKNDSDGSMTYYEVVVLRKKRGGKFVIAGKDVEFKPKESYPSDEEFGTFGWCYVRECDALARYEALVGDKS